MLKNRLFAEESAGLLRQLHALRHVGDTLLVPGACVTILTQPNQFIRHFNNADSLTFSDAGSLRRWKKVSVAF